MLADCILDLITNLREQVVSMLVTMSLASSSSALTTIEFVKRKLIEVRPPILTLPVILSRKILKRAGESTHPCRTQLVLWLHSLCHLTFYYLR